MTALKLLLDRKEKNPFMLCLDILNDLNRQKGSEHEDLRRMLEQIDRRLLSKWKFEYFEHFE